MTPVLPVAFTSMQVLATQYGIALQRELRADFSGNHDADRPARS
jgi:hypothetical protein